MTTAMASGQSALPSRGLRQWMREHPLFSYFFIAYAFTWITLIPFILSDWSILPKGQVFNLFFILHTFGPAVAAYIMFRVTEGKEGSRGLLRRLIQWRAGWQWYAFILLGIPALILLGIVVLPGALVSFQGVSRTAIVGYPISFVIIAFFGGPLGEEIGWRGFALPRMQSRYGSLRATLLLGVLWTFWHLADFLTYAQHGGPGTGLSAFTTALPVFLLQVMSLAIIFTWVFNHTEGSVFIAILLHASYNAFATTVLPLFPAPIVTATDLPFALAMAALAALILVLTGGRLGYRPDQEQPLSMAE